MHGKVCGSCARSGMQAWIWYLREQLSVAGLCGIVCYEEYLHRCRTSVGGSLTFVSAELMD